MAPPEDLYPPVTHGGVWPALAIGSLALVALWWVGLCWRSRRRRHAASEWAPLRGRALAARRDEALAAIDAVVGAHERGEISSRDAFQQLSPLVRRFVFDVAGVPAHTMTLDELARDHPGLLADVVAMLYPGEFAAVVDGDVASGARRARKVMMTWPPGDRAVVGAGRSLP